MRGFHLTNRGGSVAAAMIGLWFAGCGGRDVGQAIPTGTVNLGSLPAAEAWVDGKPAGTTPLAVSLPAGRHEIVWKQVGFSEHRESLDVQAGVVGALDATLDPISADDLDAVRQIAASFGVTVDPYQAPEMHRGGSFDGGVALMFPRNDVRREGLGVFRIDVTAAYDGKGWLEFRKGKTVLYRERFTPDTLVTTTRVPSGVVEAIRVGETITWGVWFDDGRKPVTAQFEVVNKPAASKKLAELAADKRLSKMPATVRAQLEAEVLQNYRLYSEALTRLLSNRSLDKDGTLSYQGIVSCLRRLDLEDTALFAEASLLVKGKGASLNPNGELASGSLPRLGTNPTQSPGLAAATPKSNPLHPGATAPASGGASGGTPPPAGDGADGGAPPAPIDPALRDPLRPNPAAGAEHAAQDLAHAAELQNAAAANAAQSAAAARSRATDAQAALAAARTAAQAAPEDPVARRAFEDAARNAADANRLADQAELDARNAAVAAARTTEQARLAAERAARMAGAVPGATRPIPPTTRPVPPVVPPVAPPVAPPTPPTPPTAPAALDAARANVDSLRVASDTARNAFLQAEQAALAAPEDQGLRQATDDARQAMNLADERLAAASAALAELERTAPPR